MTMASVDNAAAMWIASSGVLRAALPLELLPPASGWLIGVASLATAYAVLSVVTLGRSWQGRRPRLRLVHGGAAGRVRVRRAPRGSHRLGASAFTSNPRPG
jgi:hypothetical protein